MSRRKNTEIIKKVFGVNSYKFMKEEQKDHLEEIHMCMKKSSESEWRKGFKCALAQNKFNQPNQNDNK